MIKVLWQSYPTLLTLTDVYTSPALNSTVISSLVITNQWSIDDTIRISIAVWWAADEPKQYLYYDLVISSKDTFIATIWLTLIATDIIRVYSEKWTTSFNFFWEEN